MAVNLDRIAIVVAPSPPFSEDLLVRVLLAAETAGIEAAIIANKADLPEREAIEPRLRAYEALGYPVFRVAAKRDPDATRATLAPWLADRTTLLLGQSGMGKSTLVNLLVPDANLVTQTISEALSSGRHTTTFTRLFELPDAAGRIVDSPGFQTFGLAHLSPTQLVHGMREFVPLLGHLPLQQLHPPQGAWLRDPRRDGRRFGGRLAPRAVHADRRRGLALIVAAGADRAPSGRRVARRRRAFRAPRGTKAMRRADRSLSAPASSRR